MKIVHRIALRAISVRRQQLKQLGITNMTELSLPGGGDDLLVTLEIEEGHPSWPVISDLVSKWDMGDHPRAEFSSEEIDTAKWLSLNSWIQGYPQPSSDNSYRNVTFDLADWCQQCGLGLKQKAPFRMKGEPRWGKHRMMQMHWVYDYLFVKPEIWSTVFAQRRVKYLPVQDRRGMDLKTVVQILIDQETGVRTEELRHSICATCNRIKYRLNPREMEPQLAEEPGCSIVTTREHFGDGGLAVRSIIVGQDLVRALNAAKVSGVRYSPLPSDKPIEGALA